MRQSQLLGRSRLRGLLSDTRAAAREINHERHRFAELQGGAPVVVSAHQLFPTPPALARRLVGLAEIQPGHTVLEPSAGTGNLLRALGDDCQVQAVEINAALCRELAKQWPTTCADFLQCGRELGEFDRVIMNPPFTRGSDIRHIRHALQFVKPGGRLVALCMAGPRQRAALSDAQEWIDLPAGSFQSEGTRVGTAMVVYDTDAGRATSRPDATQQRGRPA